MLRELIEHESDGAPARVARTPVRGSPARCRASASGRFVFRLAEELGLSGFVGNDERGVFCEAEGRWPTRSTSSPGGLERRGRHRSPRSSRLTRRGDRADRPQRIRDRRIPAPAASPTPPSLPTARPARSAWPSSSTRPTAATATRSPTAPNCGPAVHDRSRRSLRPAADDDGARSRCARAAAPSTRIRATAASTLNPTPALTAGRGVWLADRRRPRARLRASAAGRDRGRGGRAAGGQDRRDQGSRRVPPRLPGRRRASGRRAALAQAPRGQAVRADGAGPGGGPRAGRADARPRRSCSAGRSGRS